MDSRVEGLPRGWAPSSLLGAEQNNSWKKEAFTPFFFLVALGELGILSSSLACRQSHITSSGSQAFKFNFNYTTGSPDCQQQRFCVFKRRDKKNTVDADAEFIQQKGS